VAGGLARPTRDEAQAVTTSDSTRRRRRVPTIAAPAAVRRQIATGGEVDYAALLDWWEHTCPPWLRDAGLSPITAAVLSVLPESTARNMPGRLRFVVTPAS